MITSSMEKAVHGYFGSRKSDWEMRPYGKTAPGFVCLAGEGGRNNPRGKIFQYIILFFFSPNGGEEGIAKRIEQLKRKIEIIKECHAGNFQRLL